MDIDEPEVDAAFSLVPQQHVLELECKGHTCTVLGGKEFRHIAVYI